MVVRGVGISTCAVGCIGINTGRFGIFHEFERPQGVSEAQAFDERIRADRRRRAPGGLGSVWLAEEATSRQSAPCWPRPCCWRKPIGAHPALIKIDVPRCRSCRCVVRSGSPREPPPLTTSATVGSSLGSVAVALRGHICNMACRARRVASTSPEPARDHPAGLDRGHVLSRREILPVPRNVPGAQALPEATSTHPRGGNQRRHVSRHQTACKALTSSPRVAPGHSRSSRPTWRSTGRRTPRRATQARAASSCACRSTWRTRSIGTSSRTIAESILAFYRAARRGTGAIGAGRRGARHRAARCANGRRLRRGVGFDEVLREKVIVGTPEMVTVRLGKIAAELAAGSAFWRS